MVEKTRLYIIGPEHNGEGGYCLLTEKGEKLAGHYCSNNSFAKNDLEGNRPERQKEWKERFGEYVVEIVQNPLFRDNLLKLNKNFKKTEE